MKNALWIAAFTLLTGLASAQTTASQKIGYTNIDYLLSQMPETKAIETELKTKETQYQNLIQQKQKALQEKLANYQKNAATMTEVIRTDMEKQLQTDNQSIQEFQQNASTELQQKQQQLLAPVLEKIDKAVKAVAKENGFTFIISSDISTQLSPVLLYVDETYNISDLVFKKLGVTPKPPQVAPTTPASTATTAPKPTPAAPKKN